MGWAARVTIALALSLVCATVFAQPPRPFPQPGQPAPPQPSTGQPPRSVPPTTTPPAAKPQTSDIPNEAMLGVPIYPTAQYITSYDAGRGQRFYLFGVATPYAEMVLFYRTVLKQKGSELFEAPPTHQFEIGRFRDETMAFPPGVTIKDWTWGGSQGYPNPKLGAQPARFPTLIVIVPAPAGSRQ